MIEDIMAKMRDSAKHYKTLTLTAEEVKVFQEHIQELISYLYALERGDEID